jgi:hypothetical protein
MLVPGAAVAGTLDQQQTDGSTNPGAVGTTESLAQTFTAGLSGGLDRVDLNLSKVGAPTNPLYVEIRGVSGGVPGATVLAGQSVPPSSVSTGQAFVPISFASPAAVVAGTQYAIVASSAAGGNPYEWHYGPGNTYAAGNPCFTNGPPSGTWSCGGFGDFAFRTYVVPTSAFTFKLSGRRLIVSVSSAGTVAVTDSAARVLSGAAFEAKKKRKLRLKPASASGGRGTISVPLALTKGAEKALKEKGSLKVNARITFTPTGGLANSQTAVLNLKGKKATASSPSVSD